MATPSLPSDFREFLRSLNGHGVKYLVVGGYAVGYYGYPRATADIDLWVAIHPDNASRLVEAVRAFGFDRPELTEALLMKPDQIIRMGVPPFRIELMTTISGVHFDQCYAARTVAELEDVTVSLISLEHLKANKRSAGRFKDLDDLEHLP
ncbi:MAG: nucleotidyltransferase [Acidobacteria bacterium]|nr:nucleotidyltransferase [Acidobacteriota bacterium]